MKELLKISFFDKFVLVTLVLLMFVLSINGTMALRNFLAVVLLFSLLYRTIKQQINLRGILKDKQFKLIFTSLLMFVIYVLLHSIFISHEPSWSLPEFRAQLIYPLLYLFMGILLVLNFDYDDTYTVCVWAYQENVNSMPVSKAMSSGNYTGWYMYYYAPSNFLYHNLYNDFWPSRKFSQTVIIDHSKWQYICVQHKWNGSAHSGNVYVNGDSQSIFSTTNTLGTYSTTTTNEFCVGSRNLTDNYMHGSIPIVQIYGTALTSEQILHNFNVDRARFGI